MITKFKIFESINIQKIKDWAYEYAKDNHAGLNSYEDAVEELDYFFDKEIELLGNKIKLFRVLGVESEDDINKDELGIHYLPEHEKEYIYDKYWYEKIGLEYNSDDIYLVEVTVTQDDINWEFTINNRLNYPRESEISLNENNNLKIDNITKLDINKIN